MAIDGTTIRAARFWDVDTNQFVEINLTIRDIVFFRLLERIAGVISAKNG
jgi:hypothetical protein